MRLLLSCGALALLAASPLAVAKPFTAAKTSTVMAEFGATPISEFQANYAPVRWAALGVGWTQFESDLDGSRQTFAYVRGNLLVHRWNLPGAQANVFVWGSLGRASGDGLAGSETAHGAGFQLDYETRRIYTSFKSDLLESASTSHRTDTLQLGWAPYEHDFDTLATWVVVQGRRYTGELRDGTETSVLLRFFKGGTWVEAGVTTDGKLQAMVMFTF